MTNDTIAAIATALNNSGIAIIRVSGDEAISIVNRIFVTPSGMSIADCDSHTIHYGHIVDNGTVVDEVMVSVMRAPRTYTREDVVEINTHGGVIITNAVLSLLLDNGARLAEPGEFSKRAFLNGRIDLSKAEAIMDVISADNEIAMKSGIKQLRGQVADAIRNIRKDIIHEIAYIESALDDPEHISLDGYSDELSGKIDIILNELIKMSDSAGNGKIVKNGITTVIVGKPNAGKSSLLNYILGEDRAIVTNIAGTTRDALEENVRIKGINLRIIDTAGIRETEDTVEKIGVEKAFSYIDDADLILYVVDSSAILDDNDKAIVDRIAGKKVIVLYNKTDLDSVVSTENVENLFASDSIDLKIIKTSATMNIGYDDFENTLYDMFKLGEIESSNEIVITNLRHKEAIDSSIDSLRMVRNSIDMSMPEDFLTIDLMTAYTSLGKIIGEEVDDDLVNTIFSEFCMGK